MQAKKKLFTVVYTVYNYSRIVWLARGIEHNIEDRRVSKVFKKWEILNLAKQ